MLELLKTIITTIGVLTLMIVYAIYRTKAYRTEYITDKITSSLEDLMEDYTTKDIVIDSIIHISNHICTYKIPEERSYIYLSYNEETNVIVVKAGGYSTYKTYNVMYDINHDETFTLKEFKIVCKKIVKLHNM